jgi:hypothetical protein
MQGVNGNNETITINDRNAPLRKSDEISRRNLIATSIGESERKGLESVLESFLDLVDHVSSTVREKD